VDALVRTDLDAISKDSDDVVKVSKGGGCFHS